MTSALPLERSKFWSPAVARLAVEEHHFAATEVDRICAVFVARVQPGRAEVTAAAHSGFGDSLACDLDRERAGSKSERFGLASGKIRKDQGHLVRVENGIRVLDSIGQDQLVFCSRQADVLGHVRG